MCGFVGVASAKNLVDHNWLNIARDSLSHRGPDDFGEWLSEDKTVGLAHRRLSILDLSLSGHQPMHMHERGLIIVFNGEIYNFIELRQQLQSLGYLFNSKTDTEVVLASYAEWGTDCLKYLDGMFAFALYDSKKKKIFIARDRAGEKPLFYHLDYGTLFFASELKALLANKSLSRKVDLESLDCYLAYGFVPGERCIFSGYKKLKPANALIFDINSGVAKVWEYWRTPKLDIPLKDIDETSLVNELELILENAVKKQLIADVPVGILLSGGIDSSLITAMAARHTNQIRTFSVGFPGHDRFDETKYSRIIASYFKTKHTELMLNPNMVSVDLLTKLAIHFDEPLADSSMIPTYLLSESVRKYCAVVLGGDGGDELFGGYHNYSRLLQTEQYLKFVPNFIKYFLSNLSARFLPIGFKGRDFFQNCNVNLSHDLPVTCHFNKIERYKLIGGSAKYSTIAETIYSSSMPKTDDLIERATLMDFKNYLAEDILVKVDRASMAHSLEIRSPMLDYRLIEFAFGKVPTSLKASTIDKKILLKKLAYKVLPANFNINRKQGFSIPLKSWLKKSLIRDYFWDTLTSKDCIFDKKIIMSILNGQDRNRNNSERIFALVQFELWRKNYRAYL